MFHSPRKEHIIALHADMSDCFFVRFTLFAIGSGGQELELLAADSGTVTAWKKALESAQEAYVAGGQGQEGGKSRQGAKIKGSGGTKVISGLHKLTDIGISSSLKLSYEMQITYEVLGQRDGVVLQYEEAVSPASGEQCRVQTSKYLRAFETMSPPRVVRYLPASQEQGRAGFFSLLLLDPDYPSVENPAFREHVHWVSDCDDE